jgi:hypothetical protein
MGHVGPGRGESFSDRSAKNGQTQGRSGENLSYGSRSGKDSLVQLLIDDGVPSRGHRNNIFNPAFHVVGVGIAAHKSYRWMNCSNYAGGFTSKFESNPWVKCPNCPMPVTKAPAAPAKTDNGWSRSSKKGDNGWSRSSKKGDNGWSRSSKKGDNGWSGFSKKGENGWSGFSKKGENGWSGFSKKGDNGWSGFSKKGSSKGGSTTVTKKRNKHGGWTTTTTRKTPNGNGGFSNSSSTSSSWRN